MRVYPIDDLNERFHEPCAVCLGMFDGVHLGHLRLIEETIHAATKQGLVAMVHTYDVLPINVIAPEKAVCELTPLPDKVSLLQQAGIEATAVSRFDERLQKYTGREFFQKVLIDKLNARHLVTGFNHRFGFHADTGVAELRILCDEFGLGLSVIPPVLTAAGEVISSTGIRTAILEGDLGKAALMLGRKPEESLVRRVLTKDANQCHLA